MPNRRADFLYMISRDGYNTAPHRRRSRLIWLLATAGYIAFLVWLYWPALDSFFANDDWVILYHNASIPPSQWWKYFSFHTVWFYRPLQSMQFGLTYHLAGLNHFVYNVELLVLHLVFCGAAWLLVKRLFSAGLATGAILMFSVSWVYADMLIWKANYNTFQFAIVTVLAALAFAWYLDTRRKAWMGVVFVLAIIDCLTKESAVGLPLVLATIWVTRFLQWKWHPMDVPPQTLPPVTLPARPANLLGRFVYDMLPASVVVSAYAVLHHYYFKNVEPNYLPGYNFAAPVQAFRQWMHGTNHSFFGTVYDPVILHQLPTLQRTLGYLVENGWYIMPAVLMLSWWRRNVAALFGVVFALVCQFPTFALDSYHASRYYYLPVLGGGIFFMSWLLPGLRKMVRRDTSTAQRIPGYAGCIFLGWYAVANIIQFQALISRDHGESNLVIRTFELLGKDGSKLPQDSMLIVSNLPRGYNNNGLGLTELVRLGTRRDDIVAVTDTEILNGEEARRFESGARLYFVDVTSTSPQVQKFERNSVKALPGPG